VKIAFHVIGKPIAQGSMKAVPLPRSRRAVVVHTNEKELLPWRRTIRSAAHRAMGGFYQRQFEGPVVVCLSFNLIRKKTVKRELPAVPPDLDKLTRAVLDAIDGACFLDDAQVCELHVKKSYADPPGVWITVEELPPSAPPPPAA
jgi:Holliday junction resolvase RusA-like endonuclease